MAPTSARDFWKAAAQRLTTAEFLLRHKHTLDAMYIGGYTVECALKALILHKTPTTGFASRLRDLSSGAKMHRPEVLLGILRDMGVLLPLTFAKKYRRANWMTGLRYETGRKDTGETRAFLRTAKETLDWVEGELA